MKRLFCFYTGLRCRIHGVRRAEDCDPICDATGVTHDAAQCRCATSDAERHGNRVD